MWLNSHNFRIKLGQISCFSDEQRKWCVEIESTVKRCCENCWNNNKIEYYINLMDKQWQSLRALTPILKEVLWGKCYQRALCDTGKSFIKGRVNQWSKLHDCLILRNCHSHPDFQQIPLWSVSNHHIERRDPPPAKRFYHGKLRWWLKFLAIKCFN